MRLFSLLCLLLLVSPLAAHAEQRLSNPHDEQRANALFYTIRCVVCEAQPIAESNTPMAAQQRTLIREQIAQGMGDDDIKRFFALRYGDDILMQPPLSPNTLLLWSAPLLFLIIGTIILYRSRIARSANR